VRAADLAGTISASDFGTYTPSRRR